MRTRPRDACAHRASSSFLFVPAVSLTATNGRGPVFRSSGLFHVISGSDGGWSQEQFAAYYSLGNGSYFSESAHDMDGFHERCGPAHAHHSQGFLRRR